MRAQDLPDPSRDAEFLLQFACQTIRDCFEVADLACWEFRFVTFIEQQRYVVSENTTPFTLTGKGEVRPSVASELFVLSSP